jgi:lipopolysaccharide/colanic/teichoic acid biosynthesis glycosyltransferase
MTFVGPRPEAPEFVELFRQDYEEILTVRPGITDLASLKYRDEAAVLGSATIPKRNISGMYYRTRSI